MKKDNKPIAFLTCLNSGKYFNILDRLFYLGYTLKYSTIKEVSNTVRKYVIINGVNGPGLITVADQIQANTYIIGSNQMLLTTDYYRYSGDDSKVVKYKKNILL